MGGDGGGDSEVSLPDSSESPKDEGLSLRSNVEWGESGDLEVESDVERKGVKGEAGSEAEKGECDEDPGDNDGRVSIGDTMEAGEQDEVPLLGDAASRPEVA